MASLGFVFFLKAGVFATKVIHFSKGKLELLRLSVVLQPGQILLLPLDVVSLAKVTTLFVSFVCFKCLP